MGSKPGSTRRPQALRSEHTSWVEDQCGGNAPLGSHGNLSLLALRESQAKQSVGGTEERQRRLLSRPRTRTTARVIHPSLKNAWQTSPGPEVDRVLWARLCCPRPHQ